MKTYEELSGGEGRRIFFRAERFKAQDLFQRTQPTLMLDHAPSILSDASLSGFSAITAANSNQIYEPEKRIHIQLKMGDSQLFSSTGEVVRIEPTQSGTKLGLRFLDQSFNVTQIVSKYKELSRLAGIPDALRRHPAASAGLARRARPHGPDRPHGRGRSRPARVLGRDDHAAMARALAARQCACRGHHG